MEPEPEPEPKPEPEPEPEPEPTTTTYYYLLLLPTITTTYYYYYLLLLLLLLLLLNHYFLSRIFNTPTSNEKHEKTNFRTLLPCDHFLSQDCCCMSLGMRATCFRVYDFYTFINTFMFFLSKLIIF